MNKSLNILTVDDEPSVTNSLLFVLENSDRKITAAFDGAEALTKVDEHFPPFDVIITDNNMPRLNGLELVRRLRERNFQGKIVVLSAHLSEEIRSAYAELNVASMVAKPFSVAALRALIDNLSKAA